MTLAFSIDSRPAVPSGVTRSAQRRVTLADAPGAGSPAARPSALAHLRHDLIFGVGTFALLLGVIAFTVFGEPRGVAGAVSSGSSATNAAAAAPDQAVVEAAIASIASFAAVVEQQRLEAAAAFFAGLAQQEAERAAADRAAAAATTSGGNTGRAAPATADGSVWDRLAQCESSGNWAINTGNGFTGGLQFLRSTWLGMGGGEYAPDAYLATREQQIDIATRVLASQGWGAWPGCSSMMGLR
jgi:hypothetical protein